MLKRLALTLLNNILRSTIKIVDVRKNPGPEVLTQNSREYNIDLSKITSSKRFAWMDLNRIKLDKLFYIELKNCRVIGNGIILNNEGKIILESNIFQLEYLNKLNQHHLILARKFLTKRKISDSSVICLSNVLEDNYYHWIIDSMARIILIEPFLNVSDIYFVINDNRSAFKIESLSVLFGIPESRILSKPTKEIYMCDAIIPSFPITRSKNTLMLDICDPEILRTLNRKATLIAENNGASKYPSKFIISRRLANSRRILNEEFLVKSLEPVGFHIVEIDNLPFVEQMRLFHGAKIIITTHGAGLTNIVFCKSATIIELFPIERAPGDAFTFTHLSSILKLNHHLICYHPANNKQDIHIDSTILSQIVAIIKGPNNTK